MVERQLCKLDVAGSRPAASTIFRLREMHRSRHVSTSEHAMAGNEVRSNSQTLFTDKSQLDADLGV